MNAELKLSFKQKQILDYLIRWTEHIEANGNDFAKSNLGFWGVEWYPSRGHTEWTRSDSASLSRALTRLVIRGLVERKNDLTDNINRAVRVRLTDLGRETAKRLTLLKTESVNRLNSKEATG